MKRPNFILLFSWILLLTGCVKETYNMDKLSGKAELSPSILIPTFKGTVVFADALKDVDSVVYDNDKFVRFIFKQDSVLDLGIKDFYNTDNMVSFTNTYTLGDVSIDPFQGAMSMSLDQITTNLSPALRATFVSLDDGSLHPFPLFPSVSMPAASFGAFNNLQRATFSSGFLDLSVTNNLPAPLNGITLSLSNSLGPVAGPLAITGIQPGETKTISVDLTGKTLTNTLNATVTFSGSPGNATPVRIDLHNNSVSFLAKGRNLMVSSGRIVLPSQMVTDAGSTDTLDIDPGEGIELEQVKLTGGLLKWNTTSSVPVFATLSMSFPGITKNSVIYSESVSVVPGQTLSGSTSTTNTTIDFSKDPKHPYNRVPVLYSIQVTSNNSIIDFNSTDNVTFNIKLENPKFDFLKGYFGQRTEAVDPDILDVGIDEVFNSITGKFSLTDPIIRINYSNSFAVPAKFNFKATGRREQQAVDLLLNNITVASPAYPLRDISSTIVINKDNSSLPELVSLPPGKIEYSGSVMMNPAGDPTHLRNNYLFGNSRILGNVEVEVPLQLSFNDFQFSDTTDNFLKDIENDIEFESLQLGLNFQNGFPFDVSAAIKLYDPKTAQVRSSIDVPVLVKSGTVDSNGKVTAKSASEAKISLTSDFLSKAHDSDKIIFSFRVSTPGTKPVKIYSDYSIDFNVNISGKPIVKL